MLFGGVIACVAGATLAFSEHHALTGAALTLIAVYLLIKTIDALRARKL